MYLGLSELLNIRTNCARRHHLVFCFGWVSSNVSVSVLRIWTNKGPTGSSIFGLEIKFLLALRKLFIEKPQKTVFDLKSQRTKFTRDILQLETTHVRVLNHLSQMMFRKDFSLLVGFDMRQRLWLVNQWNRSIKLDLLWVPWPSSQAQPLHFSVSKWRFKPKIDVCLYSSRVWGVMS